MYHWGLYPSHWNSANWKILLETAQVNYEILKGKESVQEVSLDFSVHLQQSQSLFI